MTQHDYSIANDNGAAFRSDVNNAFVAGQHKNSGGTAPSVTHAFQWWADTSSGLLKLRDSANTGWITIGTLASTNLGLLALTGGSLTGSLELDAFEDVASASPCNIGAASSNFVRITGAAAITAFDTVAAGVWRIIRFASTPLISHNAAVILPGSAAITAAANDACLAVSLGSGNWIVLLYQRASGAALAPDAFSMTSIATTAHSLTNADNGKTFVYTGSCTVNIALPSSLANGWSVNLFNTSVGSDTPLTLIASSWSGLDSPATSLRVLGRPGCNRLDVTLVGSLFYTSERAAVVGGVSPAVASRYSFNHNIAARPNNDKVGAYIVCVASDIGFSPGNEVCLASTTLYNASAGGFGLSLKTGASQTVIADVGGNGIQVTKEDFSSAVITAANWKLFLTARY